MVVLGERMTLVTDSGSQLEVVHINPDESILDLELNCSSVRVCFHSLETFYRLMHSNFAMVEQSSL